MAAKKFKSLFFLLCSSHLVSSHISFSLPRHNSDPRSPTLLPRPHHDPRLPFYREKNSALSSLVDLRRIVLTHVIQRSRQWVSLQNKYLQSLSGDVVDNQHSRVYKQWCVYYKTILNTSAASSINSRVDTHLCKLRDTPPARFYIYVTL